MADPIPPAEIDSPAVQELIRDLLDTVEEYEGAGLAAPQVHTSLRVVVLKFDGAGLRVWINPEITPLTDELVYTFEGCLSVPGMRGLVGRPGRIQVRTFERDGSHHEMELEGFAAVVAQHECDHLDGVIYVDKVVPKTLSFLEEYQRFVVWADQDDDDELDPDIDLDEELVDGEV